MLLATSEVEGVRRDLNIDDLPNLSLWRHSPECCKRGAAADVVQQFRCILLRTYILAGSCSEIRRANMRNEPQQRHSLPRMPEF